MQVQYDTTAVPLVYPWLTSNMWIKSQYRIYSKNLQGYVKHISDSSTAKEPDFTDCTFIPLIIFVHQQDTGLGSDE